MKHFKFFFFKNLSSTNEKAKELLKKGISNAVIVADTQTKGRGRFKRKWISSEGGLYFSILIDGNRPEKSNFLTFISALSVVKATVKIASLDAVIKWPNDVYIDSRKISGILTQSILGKKNHFIIGVGVNLNQDKFPKELSGIATSMKIEKNMHVDRDKFLKIYFKEFEKQKKRLDRGDYSSILDEFIFNCSTLGQSIKAKSINGNYSGKAMGIDKEGRLLIRSKEGKIIRLTEGDIIQQKL